MREKRLLNKFNLLTLEILGTVLIILLGSALHFTYEISGNNAVVGVFSAVNESVWEHMKLAFWPSVLWMILTIKPLRRNVANFFAAKTLGSYLMVTTIPIIFYTYTAIMGDSILMVDIASFLFAVIVGQLVSFKLFKYKQLSIWVGRIAIVALVLLASAFVFFTFHPPGFGIFEDPIINI